MDHDATNQSVKILDFEQVCRPVWNMADLGVTPRVVLCEACAMGIIGKDMDVEAAGTLDSIPRLTWQIDVENNAWDRFDTK